eukprot:403355409
MVESKTLKYLDPDLYVKAAGEGDIEQHYICLFCYGVVLDPTECRECQSLYCKGCLQQSHMKCPMRCSGLEYQPLNRFVKCSLEKTSFKCQNYPACREVIKYVNYSKHYEECENELPKQGCQHECEGKECLKKIQELEDKIEMLEVRSALQETQIQSYEQRLIVLEKDKEIQELINLKNDEILQQIQQEAGQKKYEQISVKDSNIFDNRDVDQSILNESFLNNINSQRNRLSSNNLLNFAQGLPVEEMKSNQKSKFRCNHTLKPFTKNRPGGDHLKLWCDHCGSTINCFVQEQYYRCEFAQCDWDICTKCYDEKSKS